MENQINWLIVLVWALNFGISWWNARAVGLVWVETKYVGGWKRFMTWMGALMSASGFTWCYLLVLLVGAYYFQPLFLKPEEPLILDYKAIEAGLSLGYLIIIPVVLFSGFMIWINSLINAWRQKDVPSAGVAGWNTFAQIHNTYRAMRGMPEAWEKVTDFFLGSSKSGSGKGKAAMLIVFLVVIAILGGILTTWGIINKYAGTRKLPKRAKL